jgi:hypothetical protein
MQAFEALQLFLERGEEAVGEHGYPIFSPLPSRTMMAQC